MNKLEKVLEDIKISDVEPSEDLISLTKAECKKSIKVEQNTKVLHRTRRAKLTVRLLGAATAVAFIFVVFLISSIRNHNPIEGAAYYTIDINPSFGFTVDENNIVIDVSVQNEDAKDIYKGMNCVGLSLQDAIRLVIAKAEENGYMSHEGKTYVLLGQFLNNESDESGEELLNHLMASLEDELGDDIELIGVSGDSEDVEYAKNLEISPGLLILCELTDDVDADQNLKVEDVVKHLPDEYNDKPEFKAPVISGSVSEGKLAILWGEIGFSNADAGIEVEYKLLKGTTLDEIKEKKNVVSSRVVSIDEKQPTSFVVEVDSSDLTQKTYYCLYVKCGSTSKLSNVLPVTAEITEATKEPEVTPEPISDDGASQISGYIKDGKIVLQWTEIENERFSGYKVMYSSTDSTPTYGEDGCYYLEYVTDAKKTSSSYKLTSLKGYSEGKKYYFSITALYDEQNTKVSGNVISKVMPKTTATPTDEPTSSDYPSTTISGSKDGDSIYLSWGKISDERLEGYKVVYSFTDSTPVYGSSDYLRWITNASTTSTVINVSELGTSSDDRTCYFSITALYEDHSVKRAGNAIAIKIPGTSPTPAPSYPSANLTSASLSDGTVTLKWSTVSNVDFSYYKVVYSFTNSSPSYPSSSLVDYFSDSCVGSCSFCIESLSGYEPGKTCYFSITTLYNDTKVVEMLSLSHSSCNGRNHARDYNRGDYDRAYAD